MNTSLSSRIVTVLGIAAPLALLATAGVFLSSGAQRGTELAAAAPSRQNDPDGDGMINAQEAVLGTNAYRRDTDYDGFSDLEELARDSSPIFSQSTPASERIHLGLTCRGGDGMLHALLAVYLPDGDLRGKVLEAGALFNHRILSLSQSFILDHARLALHDASTPGAKIAVIDFPFSPRYVYAFGHLSIFATVREAGSGTVQSADSLHLLNFGQVIVLQMPNPMILGTGGLSQGHPGGGTPSQVPIGSIYVPLPISGSENQSSWISGQVCVQQTVGISVSGAQLTQEVISAECQEGWDGFCPPSCSSTVGNTYTTIDPVVLIGG